MPHAECHNGTRAQWHNGAMAQWQRNYLPQWHNGKRHNGKGTTGYSATTLGIAAPRLHRKKRYPVRTAASDASVMPFSASEGTTAPTQSKPSAQVAPLHLSAAPHVGTNSTRAKPGSWLLSAIPTTDYVVVYCYPKRHPEFSCSAKILL